MITPEIMLIVGYMLVVGGAVALLLAVALGMMVTMEREAVDKGHAEYFLDEKHRRCFRWLPPCAGKGKS